MPTRKQRRRRDKTFRHEYDLVVVDEEGNEVPVEPAKLRAAKAKDAPKKEPRGKGGARPAREVPPPSWRRAVRRGGLMGIVLLVIMSTVLKGPVLLGVVYAFALIPFTYWIDQLAYRKYLRRTGKS